MPLHWRQRLPCRGGPRFDPWVIRQHAEGFGYPVFIERMRTFIDMIVQGEGEKLRDIHV